MTTSNNDDYSQSRGLAFFLTDDVIECIMIYWPIPREVNPNIAFTEHTPIEVGENAVIKANEPIAAVTYSAFTVYEEAQINWGKRVLDTETAEEMLRLVVEAEYIERADVSFATEPTDTHRSFEVVYANGEVDTFYYAMDNDSGEYRFFKAEDDIFFLASGTEIGEFIKEQLAW